MIRNKKLNFDNIEYIVLINNLPDWCQERIKIFINSLQYYLNLKLFEYADIDDFILRHSYKDNYLVILHYCNDNLYDKFNEIRSLSNLIVFDSNDIHSYRDYGDLRKNIGCIIFNSGLFKEDLVGWVSNKAVYGYGFIHSHPLKITNSSLDYREDKFCFRGNYFFPNYQSRLDFLTKFKATGKSHITICNKPRLKEIKKEDLWGSCDYIEEGKSLEYCLDEMGRFKYVLAPYGVGHTFRVAESFASRCVTIAENLQELKLILPFFEDGNNFISIDNFFKNNYDYDKIADNGQKTYHEYFYKDGALPSKTFDALINTINSKLS